MSDDDEDGEEVVGMVLGDDLAELSITHDGSLHVEIRGPDGRYHARITFGDTKFLRRFLRDMHEMLPP